MKFITDLNLNQNELQNPVLQKLSTPPANPVEGQFYYDSTDKVFKTFNGTSWVTAGSTYVLPIATDSALGGIKVGSGVSISAEGVLSADVTSVAGKTGAVTLDKTDVGLGNVDNTSDANKPVSTATQTALNSKQDTLVSGTNIKTINGASILGAGNIELATETELDNYLPLAGGTMTGNIAMGTNAITGLATPTNNSDAATKGYVDSIATGAIKPSGSVAFASLPALAAGVLNNMYNITDAFTTTADFVEGAGKEYPAGTNVVIINTGTAETPVYKYDAMTGTIDTSGFATKTAVNGLITSTSGTIDNTKTTVTVNYTGTLVNFYATQGGVAVITDVTVTSSSVTFTVTTAPTTDVVCTVVSAGTLS